MRASLRSLFLRSLILLFTLHTHAQGDLGNTMSTGLGKSNVMAIKKTSTFTPKGSSTPTTFNDFIVVQRKGKPVPSILLTDSTERIERYLTYDEKGRLLVDSASEGDYTQHFFYDEKGRVIRNIRTGFKIDTVNWDRRNDTVFCTLGANHMRYMYIIEDKKFRPVKILAMGQDKKLFVYSEYFYDKKGSLTREVYYNSYTGAVAIDYQFVNDKAGLFLSAVIQTVNEPEVKVSYIYGW